MTGIRHHVIFRRLRQRQPHRLRISGVRHDHIVLGTPELNRHLDVLQAVRREREPERWRGNHCGLHTSVGHRNGSRRHDRAFALGHELAGEVAGVLPAHVAASLTSAKAVLNEGSWLVWSPPGSVVTVPQTIYEAAYGNDINFHAIGPSTIVMSGVYSHTDNSPHNQPNQVNPGLSDPSLNFAKTIYRGGANAVNGNDASYRGINIERGAGTVQWGDGTHANFFLPSAPSPAEPDPPLGKKNAYINLRGGNLAFNYNGPVTLHVGITGGGGGPHRDGTVGTGNVKIMGTSAARSATTRP